MRALKKRGVRALAWDFAGSLSTRGVAFAVTLVLARLLSPEDFGLVALIIAFAAVGDVFIDGGLGIALIQRRHVHAAHYSAAFYFNVLIGAVLGVLLFLSAERIGDLYQQPQLGTLLKAASPLFLISSLGITQRVILRRDLNTKRLSAITLLGTSTAGGIAIVFAAAGYGVWALVIQILSTSAISGALFWYLSDWRPKAAFSWKALKGLWGFGLDMFLARLIDSVYARVDYVIIGKLFPIATLGYFQRAKVLNQLAIQYSSGSLMSVLLPVLSKIQKDLPRFQSVVLKSYKVVLFVSFLLFGGVYVTSEPLVVFLYSEKWRPSADYLAVLALSGVAYPVNSVLVNVLSSRGRGRQFLLLELLKKIIGVMNMVVGFSFGLMTYLYGLVVVSVLGMAANIYFAAREAEIAPMQFVRPFAVQAAIAVVAIGLMAVTGAAMPLEGFNLLVVSGTAYVLVYWGLSALLSTSAYGAFYSEFQPLIAKLAKRLRFGRRT